MDYNSLMFFIVGIFVLDILYSIYNVLVGKKIIKNVMYDNEEKIEYIRKKGIRGIIIKSILLCLIVAMLMYLKLNQQ